MNLIFQTPGLIDIRAFTIFGVNAKPNTNNPIGYFGTGLKYAIAALTRLGSCPIIYIGRDKYTFYTKTNNFRNTELRTVMMKKDKWSLLKPSYHELPFTTELGKNWKPWQIFRELEANTRDEKGETYISEPDVQGEINCTRIIINNEDLLSAYYDRDSIFLPNNLAPKQHSEELQVFNQPSKYLYYRGLRVAELEKPTLYTYNCLKPQILTEDRTLSYQFDYRNILAKYVSQSEDEDLIRKILAAKSTSWEHELDFDYIYQTPSAFISSIFSQENAKSQKPFSTAAYRWYGSYTHDEPDTPTLLDKYPLPWRVDGTRIRDDYGNEIIQACEDILDRDDGVNLLELIVETMNNDL